MTPLDFDLFRKIHILMGVTPDFFEVCLMVCWFIQNSYELNLIPTLLLGRCRYKSVPNVLKALGKLYAP
jgi:hypothetical protein